MGEQELGSRLLRLLLEGGEGFVSGEKLSESLGVTRAAVWKEITRLRGFGFVVESATRRGYRLAKKPNLLWPELVKAEIDAKLDLPIIYLKQVDSTILEANRRMLDGAPSGTVVLADSQSAGIGRLGRSFHSQPGVGVYLALLYKPTCGVQQLGLLTSLAGLAVCQAVEELCDASPAIKWPNDIILERRKICGILTRLASDAETNTVTHAIIGLGVNVLAQEWPQELREKAVSIQEIVGREVSRAAMAGRIITHLHRMLCQESWLENPPAQLHQELRRRSCTLGQQVLVTTPISSRQGRAVDINAGGELLVEFAEGIQAVSAGEVSVRGLLGYTPGS